MERACFVLKLLWDTCTVDLLMLPVFKRKHFELIVVRSILTSATLFTHLMHVVLRIIFVSSVWWKIKWRIFPSAPFAPYPEPSRERCFLWRWLCLLTREQHFNRQKACTWPQVTVFVFLEKSKCTFETMWLMQILFYNTLHIFPGMLYCNATESGQIFLYDLAVNVVSNVTFRCKG